MIEVRELYKTFGNKVAIDGLSFTVHSGEIYGLLGPNGSGKSTVLKILAGILKPTRGQVLFEGVEAEDLMAEDPVKVKKIVGYVPETPILYESLTPGELFDFVGKIRGIPKDELEKKVNYFVRAFAIESYIDQFIGTLSFGTQQKVSLITALLHDPRLLILDEAMNGLDPKSARILRELLIEFKKEGKSIIFSTHILALAEMICDRIGIIYRGKLIAEGDMEELKERVHEVDLENIFLKLTESKEEVLSIVHALKESL
jgi:ABC-2 type transport system ATP-binding protein